MNEVRSRPPIAIIIPGGIGTGHNNIGVPVLERIVKRLAVNFDITVFQLYPVNDGYIAEGFELIPTYSTNLFIKGWKFFSAFRRQQRKKKFVAVHGFWALPNGLLAVVVGKLYKIKSIISILGGDAVSLPEINYGQLRSRLYRQLIFWSLRHADEINALTSFLINNLKEAGFHRRDFNVIPWGIDTKLFSFREKPLGTPIQFLHIGNLHPVKDQETLLRAFKIIVEQTPSHLTLIGVGGDEGNVRKLIADLSLEKDVALMGLVQYEHLVEYYHRADILLHPSRSEGQSEVVTEAMSAGVIVAGTKVGLMYDLPECCIAVDIRDHVALAKKVLSILQDPSKMQQLKFAASRWTTLHDIDWTVGEIAKTYLSP